MSDKVGGRHSGGTEDLLGSPGAGGVGQSERQAGGSRRSRSGVGGQACVRGRAQHHVELHEDINKFIIYMTYREAEGETSAETMDQAPPLSSSAACGVHLTQEGGKEH